MLMRCLSLWQPWASLVISGAKRFETRSWSTAYRGLLVIHAAKKWDADLAYLCATEPFKAALEAAGIAFSADLRDCQRGWNLPFGALLGAVELVGCHRTEEINRTNMEASLLPDGGPPWIGKTEHAFGDYSPGRFAWLLRDPRPFPEPIPYAGARNLFDVPDGVLP
jgi:hypothetical protein